MMHYLQKERLCPARRHLRRGITSILAMLYLVLFGTLAIGFYASTTMTVQVAANDERASRAQLAAESGMDFMRRHLAKVNISTSRTPDEVLGKLHIALRDRLEWTANLGPNKVSFDGSTIRIPAIDLGKGSHFTATIALADPASDEPDIRVRVTGTASNFSGPSRDVSLVFALSEWPATIFDFGIATRSTVRIDSNARVRGLTDPQRGSMLITSMEKPALNLSGNSEVSGKVSLVNTNNAVSKSVASTVNGTTKPVASSTPASDIELAIAPPQFPEVDTSPFKKFAGNPLYGGTVVSEPGRKFERVHVKNLLIKANTNPTFGTQTVVEGVVYIETPNRVTFDSNMEVRGVIAAENDPVGTPGSNVITFRSNTTMGGLDELPPTPDFPQELRDMAGALILAPTFLVHINSNFGAMGGHLVASQFHFDSNAQGTIYGSVINLDETGIHLNSNVDLAFSTPIHGLGPGLRFGGHFMPEPDTYREGF